MPFGTNFEELCTKGWIDFLAIRDTVSGKRIFSCSDTFEMKVSKDESNSYFITIKQWNPLINKRDFFCRFKLESDSLSYTFSVDSLAPVEILKELEDVKIDSVNAERIGYLSVIALMYEPKPEYVKLFQQSIELDTPDTSLIWYPELLESIHIFVTNRWNVQPFLGSYSYPIIASGRKE